MVGRETNSVGLASIADVFATPTLAALLSEFALDPDRWFYQRELVRRTRGTLYLVQRELKRLEHVGLIAREERGRQVEYRYNSEHPAAYGLRDAMLKTLALGDRLRSALRVVEGVELAFVFGSVARQEESATSDLDLFVVGPMGMREIAATIMPVVRQIGREPNIVVMSSGELRAKFASGDHFVSTVAAEPKLWLVGDDAKFEYALS